MMHGKKTQLMCKVTGGVLRDEDGNAFKSLTSFGATDYTNINNAFAQGYQFWDWNTVSRADGTPMEGRTQGIVEDCMHVTRAINSEEATLPKDYDWKDPKTFANGGANVWTNNVAVSASDSVGSFTDGRAVASVNHIMALKKAGWIEYQPFAARMSSFYDKNWKHWNPKNCANNEVGAAIDCGATSGPMGAATIQGFGSASVDSHFAGTPLGHRILTQYSPTVAGTAVYTADAVLAIGQEGAANDALYMGGKTLGKLNAKR